MPTEPTLEELIQKAIDALIEIVNKRLKNKELRDRQRLRTSDGANVVPGYGALSATSPSDSAIDAWSDAECDAFANACKARSEAVQNPGGPQ